MANTNSKTCRCESCQGANCQCGCQGKKLRSGCQCGEVCKCGKDCACPR
jgi:hypothetical protein